MSLWGPFIISTVSDHIESRRGQGCYSVAIIEFYCFPSFYLEPLFMVESSEWEQESK